MASDAVAWPSSPAAIGLWIATNRGPLGNEPAVNWAAGASALARN